MKNLFKNLTLSLALFAFAACGGGNSSSSNEGSSQNPQMTLEKNSIKIIDGYIKNATVRDSLGHVANYKSNGIYVFNSEPKGSIYVYGGNFQDSGVENKFDYKVDSKYKIISPLTHFVTNYPNQKTNLLKSLNLSEDDLNTDFLEKLKENKDDQKWQNVAKTAQIFYALETNDLLKDLKYFNSFDDITHKSLNLANLSPSSSNLIISALNLNADELLKAEGHLANLKTLLIGTASKESGIRLDGKWKVVLSSSHCDKNKNGSGTLIIQYNQEIGYTMTTTVEKSLIADTCEVVPVYELEADEATYSNIKYPLPISEFENALELSKLLTYLESDEDLNAKGIGVKLLSPDKFINTSNSDYGTATTTYTKIK